MLYLRLPLFIYRTPILPLFSLLFPYLSHPIRSPFSFDTIKRVLFPPVSRSVARKETRLAKKCVRFGTILAAFLSFDRLVPLDNPFPIRGGMNEGLSPWYILSDGTEKWRKRVEWGEEALPSIPDDPPVPTKRWCQKGFGIGERKLESACARLYNYPHGIETLEWERERVWTSLPAAFCSSWGRRMAVFAHAIIVSVWNTSCLERNEGITASGREDSEGMTDWKGLIVSKQLDWGGFKLEEIVKKLSHG